MPRAANDELIRSILEKRFVPSAEFVASTPPLAPPPDLSTGRPFGKYVLLRRIGEGGFGRVFLAVDPLLQRRVALKLLKGGTPEDVARFGREARMAADLRHPNIIPVHDVGQVGKDFYIALDYIDGAPLAPSELDRDLRVAMKVASALGAAHVKGMIHRDVKPGNILVDAKGEPFLTDFGLARRFGAAGSLTQSGSLMGTPGFMSPEQARGELRLLGPASDVFSLGATLYYLFTRRAPFEGETELEIIRKVIEVDPRPPRSIDPRIPREVEAILAKAMAKEPGRRYPTATEMAEDFERFLDHRPVLAARRRLFPPAAVASALLAAAVASFLLWPAAKPEPPPPVPVASKPAPTPPRVVPVKRVDPVPPPKEPAPEPPPPAPPKPAPEPPKEPAAIAIDPALSDRVRKRLLDQPEYYVHTFSTDGEIRRARDLLSAGRGSEEDAAFLRDRMDRDVAGAIEKEKEFLAAAVAAREPDPRRVDAPDVIKFKDRRLEVRVLEESASTLKYVYKGQTITQPRSEVESIARGAAPAIQFHKKLEAAASAPELTSLAEWCRENRLDLQREYALYRVLAIDPANAAARRDLGLPLTGSLRGAPGAESAPERVGDGYVYEGKTYTAAALRQTLTERGYRVVDGHWCSTREWRWVKPKTLKVGGSGVAIQSRDEVRMVEKYDVVQLKLVQTQEVVKGFSFVGPIAGAEPRAKGTAILDIEAPGPILECRIYAAASVTDGRGSISVQVRTEGRDPVPLYAISSGTHRKPIDAGEALRGARKFSLVAEMETEVAAIEGRAQTFAYFLPGDAKESEPLWIEGRVAEPAPQLDKLIPPK